jgi:2-keto-4-pentenoate hydratase/2-oxohepta-3-ene-1,7-dioic acid hydratase in catechol pathway
MGDDHDLGPGDTVEVEVNNVGTLYHPVADEVR